jgi:hypothetical protein
MRGYRKVVAVVLVAAGLLVGAGGTALARTIDGTGVDGSGPLDPTSCITPQGANPVFLAVGTSCGGGVGVGVQVGQENTPNSLGRLGVALLDNSPYGNELAEVYFEDYTTGNAIATLIFDVNNLIGCVLVHTNGQPCTNTTDAGLSMIP